MNKDYTRYSITTGSEDEKDILIAVLSDWGIEGFEEGEGILYASGSNGEIDELEIDGYLAGNQIPFQKTIIPAQNWNAVWESNFEPVLVDDFVGIRADFHSPLEGVAHEIVITPKMSFGTGHHATTYLVMQLMREINFTGLSVFDFGTGTGILAILAEKLGGANILSVDYDEWCIINAEENISKNECANIELKQSDAPPADTLFDVVLANINRNIILSNLAILTQITKINGCLLLSGLLNADGQEIIAAVEEQGLTLKKRVEKNGWIALFFNKS